MHISLDEAMASGRGTERPFTCPSHDDVNPSASVNVVKGVWFCYVCFASGALKDHVPDIEEAIKVLRGDSRPRVYEESWLDLFDADHCSPYWVSRVGIEVASANRCGTTLTGEPTYPLRDSHGRLLGVVTRHEDKPKYRYPFNVSTSTTVYGRIKPSKVVVLVEGAGDEMALEQGLMPPSWTALGTYGAGLHYPQIEMVERCNPSVVLAAFDDDDAGTRARLLATALLPEHPVLSVPWRSFGGKDAAEVHVNDRVEALRTILLRHGYTREAAA